MAFILVLTLYYKPIEKRGNRSNAVRPAGFSSVKVVLPLVTKILVVEVRIPIIKVGELCFQRLLLKIYLDWSEKRGLVLVLILVFQARFHELFEKLLIRGQSGSWGEGGSLSPVDSQRRCKNIVVFGGGSE